MEKKPWKRRLGGKSKTKPGPCLGLWGGRTRAWGAWTASLVCVSPASLASLCQPARRQPTTHALGRPGSPPTVHYQPAGPGSVEASGWAGRWGQSGKWRSSFRLRSPLRGLVPCVCMARVHPTLPYPCRPGRPGVPHCAFPCTTRTTLQSSPALIGSNEAWYGRPHSPEVPFRALHHKQSVSSPVLFLFDATSFC